MVRHCEELPEKCFFFFSFFDLVNWPRWKEVIRKAAKKSFEEVFQCFIHLFICTLTKCMNTFERGILKCHPARHCCRIQPQKWQRVNSATTEPRKMIYMRTQEQLHSTGRMEIHKPSRTAFREHVTCIQTALNPVWWISSCIFQW